MAMLGKMRRKRFGEILVAEKLINQDQVNEALQIQKEGGDSLGSILLDLGYISESDIVKALSIQYQLPYLATANYEIDTKLLQHFDKMLLHRHSLLPFDRIGSLLLVMCPDIPTKPVMSQLQKACRCDIALFLSTSTDVRQTLTGQLPLSSDETNRLREERQRAKPKPVASGSSSNLDIETLEVSSEKLLSSLDEAWDSIFVDEGVKEQSS